MIVVAALLPVAWMPMTVTRPSHLLYWLLYLTVYLPSVMVPFYLQLESMEAHVETACYFLAGLAVIGLARLPPGRPVTHH